MTRVPRVQQLVKEIFGKEGHKGVNPDEVVAIGAAIQGAQLLLGSKSEVLLVDVTPLSLGIETDGRRSDQADRAQHHAFRPTKKNVFSTADGQPDGGDDPRLPGRKPDGGQPGNRLLAQFNLEGIPPAPRGMPQIEVTFDIDHNGILNVSAKDLGTGKEQKIRIESSSGLSSTEVERMRKEAEAHAEEDRRKRELIDVSNQADQMVYQVEKLLKDNAGQLSEADRGPVQAAIEKVSAATGLDDVQEIRRAVEELRQASQAMGQHVRGRQTVGAVRHRPRQRSQRTGRGR